MAEPGSYKNAKGVFPRKPGDEKSEVTLRRLRGEWDMVILACPFCKSQLVHVANTRDDCFVECLNNKCKTQGPTGSTPFEAIEKWNAAPR